MRRRGVVVIVIGLAVVMTACDARLTGDNSQGQLGTTAAVGESTVDVGDPWLILEAGTFHTCGITNVRELWCWGDNGRGQTGNGTVGGDQLTPAQVGTADGWQQIAPGFRHTCGIRQGELWCWGNDVAGQLGNGASTTANQGSPVRVGTASDWVSVTSGRWHSCAIRSSGSLSCWGENSSGQLGLGDTVGRDVPTALGLGTWASVDAGVTHTCALDVDRDLYCWGSNSNGQLGSIFYAVGATQTTPLHAVEREDGRAWKQVSAGEHTTCAIRTETQTDPYLDSDLWCWGEADQGQIKGVDAAAQATPVAIEQGELFLDPTNPFLAQVTTRRFSQVSVGLDHVCAVQTHSYVAVFENLELLAVVTDAAARLPRCWGDDTYGQLGIDEGASASEGDPTTWSVSAGGRHSLVLTYGP